MVRDPGWNFADVWEAIADRRPGDPAQVDGVRRFTWADFDRRADGIARTLLDAGLGHQDKVAQYLFNGAEYLESMFGIVKAGLVPVNSNYRYTDDELLYLWDNADAAAILVHADLGDRAERLRSKLPAVKAWLWVDAVGGMACPDWAIPYEAAADSATERVRAAWGRTGDDTMFLYTGGTTGLPKGVMWPQHDLFLMLETAGAGRVPPVEADAPALAEAITKPGPRFLPASPMMHGTAQWHSFPVLDRGGSIITMANRHFDPVALLDTAAGERVSGFGIVGDVFGRPLLDCLDAEPDRWDLSRLRVLMSSGVMLSADSKRRLLVHLPGVVLIDGLGSSESGRIASSTTRTGDAGETALFKVDERTRVIDDQGHDVVPGSGARGRLAVAGYLPIGYYKDPEKTAATFVDLDGRRYVVAGDWAEVEMDGTLRLVGRGSGCINTGGEKVYPEEVEEALKTFPTVVDAAVIGLPDERFGQSVTALVELTAGATLDEQALLTHVRQTLAAYKSPRSVLAVDSVGRLPNGKMDYQEMTREALEQLGSDR